MTDNKLPYAPAPEDDEFHDDPPVSNWQSNIPALVGFIILAIVVIWGLVHLVTLAQPWFTSLFPHPATAPKSQSSKMPAPVMTQVAKPSTEPPTSNALHTSATPTATPADLVVHILAVGIIDPMSGQFINRYPTSPTDVAAVEFDIANDGGSSTGVWHFDAQLPTSSFAQGYDGTQSGYLYTSPAQQPLGHGDHIVNTLRFTDIAPGGGTFQVIVDPRGEVRESNKANNMDQVFVSMPSYY